MVTVDITSQLWVELADVVRCSRSTADLAPADVEDLLHEVYQVAEHEARRRERNEADF